jgi:general secretion pathway protein M
MTALTEKLRRDVDTQLAPLRGRYEALQPREQRFVAAAGVAVALGLIYLAVWQPAAQLHARYARQLEASRALAARLEVAAVEVRAAGPASGPVAGRDLALLTAVDQAAKNGGLSKAPSRLQPDGESQVRVWLDQEQFDSLVRWMNELQTRYGLRIDAADIERQPTPGVVNARLTLVRGS